MKETWVWLLGWKDPMEKGMVTYSSILVWRIHGQRTLVGYSPWGGKESDMTEWWTLSFCFHFRFPFQWDYTLFIWRSCIIFTWNNHWPSQYPFYQLLSLPKEINLHSRISDRIESKVRTWRTEQVHKEQSFDYLY